MLTEQQLEDNYNLHLKIIDKYISEERKEAVKAMIETLGENYLLSPASGKNWYHGAFAGGYLNHVNLVVKLAVQQMNLFAKAGGNVDFTEEELVFAALFHDLGKVGNGEKPGFLPQTSEWHIKNQGSVFVNNPEIDFMMIPDRSLFLLQKFGIKISLKEYLAIKLHDGLFDETNKPYYVSYNPESKLRSNIVYILHAADMLAAKIEYDTEHKTEE